MCPVCYLSSIFSSNLKIPEAMSSQRSEEFCGIVAYANSEKGFQGILKQRYSDFIVREIDKSGVIAQLTTLSGKELQSRSFPDHEKPDIAPEAVAEFVASLRGFVAIDDVTAVGMIEFLHMAAARETECPDSFTVCGSTDKPTRSAIHQLFKTKFKGLVESDTMQVNGVSSIRIQPSFKLKKGWNNRASENWPSGLPNYLKFVLGKENCDTATAVATLCTQFRCNPDSIKYAGTKDKRGITFQYMTMYRRKPSDLTFLNRHQYPPTIRVGNFQYVNEQLGLGDLIGNQFEITLRDVTASADELEKLCTALRQSGFINYYGLQRFGVGGTSNQDIGLAVFKGNWKQAVEMIFAEKQGDRCELEKMKACYRDGNFSDAAYHCPRHMNIEKCILEHLSKYQNDFAGALATAPKSSSLMWAHAYQSYIWNKVVTYRIQQYGLNVVEGDLVGNGTSSNGHDVEEDTSTHVVSDSFTRVGTMTEDCITVVTADDVVSNKYSIEDIVIPLPGSSVIMPTNSVAEHYEDLLSADGLSLIYFKDKTPLQYRMKGTYRRIVQGASDLTWSIKAYNEPNENLNTTELKALDDTRPAKKRSRENEDLSGALKAGKADESMTPLLALQQMETPLKVRMALSINFSLPSGTYATMLLRELTKQSMETQFHAGMTKENAAIVAVSSNNDCKPLAGSAVVV